ncbi:hypothetical protein [Hymenobacter siberiensis]|jgi:uncharacterized protein (DUF1015 family)|nr:hypothetical protein [Hymenobacter siberiensis]
MGIMFLDMEIGFADKTSALKNALIINDGHHQATAAAGVSQSIPPKLARV